MRATRLVPTFLLLATLASALTWSAGCSGCNGGEEQPEGRCPEVPCGLLERCVEGVCVSLSDVACVPPCGDGFICNLGECVEGVETCSEAGQTCDPRSPISGEFYCIDWDGLEAGGEPVCSNRCALDGTCPEGESCFLLNGLDDSPCSTDFDCKAGTLCRQGACRAAACQPSECEGFLSGQQTCQDRYADVPEYAAGAKCYDLPDGSSFCFPAGLGQVWDTCDGFLEVVATGDLSTTCGEGLGCVQGTCQLACAVDDDCDAEQTCLFAEDDLIASGVGFCGRVCTPFSVGECGEASKCLPLDGERGYCVPAGEAEAFDACLPNAWECVEGTTCVDLGAGQGGAPEGRCMPLCDVTVAPPDPSQPVTEADQRARDATCPQPEEVVRSFVRVGHRGVGVGPLDLYLDRGQEPWIAGLEEGRAYEGVLANQGWVTLAPGQHLVSILPAGTPASEAPLLELTFALQRDRVYELSLFSPDPRESEHLRARISEAFSPEDAELRVLNLAPDLDEVDVVASPAGGGEPVELASGLGAGAEARVELAAGEFDVRFWRAGSRAPADLLATSQGFERDEAAQTLYLVGTLDPDDARPLDVAAEAPPALPEEMERDPRMLCNDLGNGAYGFCQQICRGAEDYGRQACDGVDMGCYPVRLPGFQGYQSLCQPGGAALEGERCDPFAAFSQCAPGLYCLEYGNADAEVAAGAARGKCTSLCVDDDPDNPHLSCGEGLICQPIDPESFDIGQCGYPCAPDARYTDAMCPAGLGSCKPSARLVDDTTSAGEAAPIVEELDPVCSASGALGEAASCFGADCEPGTECLYPRSAQGDLVSTLLSPYFGAAGLTPSCQPQCDPFDGVRSEVRCGPDETCLVNFPWSADVGHCAPIVEQASPFQACTRPGESCGEDSVCAIDGGSPFCLRLCEYTGGPSADVFNQSTCPAGYQCAPLVNDIGVCR